VGVASHKDRNVFLQVDEKESFSEGRESRTPEVKKKGKPSEKSSRREARRRGYNGY